LFEQFDDMLSQTEDSIHFTITKFHDSVNPGQQLAVRVDFDRTLS